MNRLTRPFKNNKSIYTPYNDERNLTSIVWNLCQKLGQLEDLMEKYNIDDLVELEIALDQYYHRYDKVETRRVNNGI